MTIQQPVPGIEHGQHDIHYHSFTNVNGEVVKDLGKFDIGVQFGTAGIGEDDIRSTSFTLSSDAGPLTLDDLALQDFAVRLTSVGEEGGDRDGSLKLGGTAPEAPEVQPAGDAIDDASVVFDSNQAIETDGTTDSYFDFAEGLFSNVLQNDLAEDGTAYTGSVTAVNGDAASVGQQVDGSNGGSIIINADGTFDFSAAGTDGVNDFDHLAEDESLATTFTYAVEGGDTATVTVTVFGAGDAGLGGGDGGGSSDFPFDDFA